MLAYDDSPLLFDENCDYHAVVADVDAGAVADAAVDACVDDISSFSAMMVAIDISVAMMRTIAMMLDDDDSPLLFDDYDEDDVDADAGADADADYDYDGFHSCIDDDDDDYCHQCFNDEVDVDDAG